MPDVTFSIGMRQYTLRCAAGQEDDLRRMAAALDQRIHPLTQAAPGADDRQLLVIAALALLDELATAAPETSIRQSDAGNADGEAIEWEAANRQLREENGVLRADLAALRQWADSMAERLTALSQSLDALAQAPTED